MSQLFFIPSVSMKPFSSLLLQIFSFFPSLLNSCRRAAVTILRFKMIDSGLHWPLSVVLLLSRIILVQPRQFDSTLLAIFVRAISQYVSPFICLFIFISRLCSSLRLHRRWTSGRRVLGWLWSLLSCSFSFVCFLFSPLSVPCPFWKRWFAIRFLYLLRSSCPYLSVACS